MVLEIVLVDEFIVIMNGDIEIYNGFCKNFNRILLVSFMVFDFLYGLELDFGEMFLCDYEKWKK